MAKNLSTLIWCAFILMIVAVYISFLPDPDGVDIGDNLYMFSNKVAIIIAMVIINSVLPNDIILFIANIIKITQSVLREKITFG